MEIAFSPKPLIYVWFSHAFSKHLSTFIAGKALVARGFAPGPHWMAYTPLGPQSGMLPDPPETCLKCPVSG